MLEPIIEPTVAAFDDLQPAVLMPAHCTGWKAVRRFAHRYPDAFAQSGRHDDLALINEQAVGHRTSITAGAPRYQAITLGRPESTTERGLRAACQIAVRSVEGSADLGERHDPLPSRREEAGTLRPDRCLACVRYEVVGIATGSGTGRHDRHRHGAPGHP